MHKDKDFEHVEILTKGTGGLVLDTRRSITKPKYVGLILPAIRGSGYRFCPWTLRTFVFDKRIPKDNFRTPKRAGDWIKKHSICWTNRRYTFFNPLIRLMHELPLSKIGQPRMQIALTQVVLTIFLLCIQWQPYSTALLILSKVLAVGFAVGAAINIYLLFIDN